MTFNDANGNLIVTEKFVVTDHEEDIENPDKFRVIFDFQKVPVVYEHIRVIMCRNAWAIFVVNDFENKGYFL